MQEHKKYSAIKREIEELIFKLLNDECLDMRMSNGYDHRIIEALSSAMNDADLTALYKQDLYNDRM